MIPKLMKARSGPRFGVHFGFLCRDNDSACWKKEQSFLSRLLFVLQIESDGQIFGLRWLKYNRLHLWCDAQGGRRWLPLSPSGLLDS